MQDIDKFGFNLMALAKTENYPWASPEAAVESVMDMSPEEFMVNTQVFLLDYEGTEGIGSVIKDAWDWFVNLIKRFWNWITGNNKKEEKKINEVQENIKTLNKENSIKAESNKTPKQTPPKNKISNNFEADITDKSKALVFGEDGSLEFKNVYFGVMSVRFSALSMHVSNINDFISDIIDDLNGVKSWKDFATKVDGNKLLDKVKNYRNEVDDIASINDKDLSVYTFKTINDAAKANRNNYEVLKSIKDTNKEMEQNVNKLQQILNKIDPGLKGSTGMDVSLQRAITLYISSVYPKYKKNISRIINRMDVLYKDCINRNRKSAKALLGKGVSGESEEFDYTNEYILDDFTVFDIEGTEGFMDKVKAGWEWIVNLFKRFINWITGRSKSAEKVEKSIVTKASKLDKIIKEKKTGKNGAGEAVDNFHIYRNDNNGNNAEIVYMVQVNTDVSTFVDALRDAVVYLATAIKSVKNPEDFYKYITEDDDINRPLNTIQKVTDKYNESLLYDLVSITGGAYIKQHSNTSALIQGLKTHQSFYSQVLKITDVNIESFISKGNSYSGNFKSDNKSLVNDIASELSVIINIITKAYNIYLKLLDVVNKAFDKCINLTEGYISENTSNVHILSVDEMYSKFNSGDSLLGLESEVFGFCNSVDTISYEGLESEYIEIKDILNNCDMYINGTEGFTDKVKLYAHKAWDAIRRFFYWIASKFSDKYKEKYAIEKIRAGFNSIVSEYGDYMSYDEFHEGYNIGKKAMNELMGSLGDLSESKESEDISMFDITSGLESSTEGKSITVTDYEAMNKAMDQIGEDAKDLATFTKFLVDMMKNYQASESDFKACLTPGLKEFPNKLSKIKFPGTKTITPKEAVTFKKEVNDALDNCKQFKAVIDFLNKNKTSVDKYLSHPAIKDHEMTKAILEAMNRYYIPAVKQITNIIDWYLRCINTDMRKMKDAINSK